MIHLEWSQIKPDLVNTKPYQNLVHLYSTNPNPIRILSISILLIQILSESPQTTIYLSSKPVKISSL